MNREEIARIARTLLLEYGLPFKLDSVGPATAGQCAVAFSDHAGRPALRVDVWCDEKTSALRVRQALLTALDIDS